LPAGETEFKNGAENSEAWKRGNPIKVKIGRIITLGNCLIDASNPEYSNICDASGYPIWGKVNVEVSSLATATVQMLGLGEDAAQQNVSDIDKYASDAFGRIIPSEEK
jgi:hypothetical protein